MTQFFKKIFGHSKSEEPATSPEETLAPQPPEGSANGQPASNSGQPDQRASNQPTMREMRPLKATVPVRNNHPQHLASAYARSIGQQRDHNEDSSFLLTSMLSNENQVIPFGLYIVADGMGGHMHGEIASGIAVRALSKYLVQHLYIPLLQSELQYSEALVKDLLQKAAQEAHQKIIQDAPGGGTTLSLALICGGQVTIAHVGDSRIYRVSDAKIEALTQDHSLVGKLLEMGQITPSEAARHPQRNVLYRALGQGDGFDVDLITLPSSNDSLLICSDGLWGVVSEKDLLQVVHSSASLEQACQRLVNAANTAGGPDNVTALLVRLPSGDTDQI